MKDKYLLGIIGFGGMAGHHYTQLSKGNTKVSIKGVFDINPARLEAAKKKGLVAYSSKEELLNDPEIDIVLVSTTNEVHAELAIEAMECGKHVICEKPVTPTAEELLLVMEAAKKYNKVFTVDQNRRTNKDFVLMKKTVESGVIGKPYVIESRVEGSRGMPSGWRTIKALGGGMMLDWGVHLIDQLMYMFDEKVTSVYCTKNSLQYPEVDDNFRMVMIFANGVEARVEVATNNYITHPRWYVLGENGTLQIDDWNCDGKVVRCIDKEDKWAEEIVYTKAGPTKTMAPRNPNSVETITLSEPLDVEDNLDPVYRQMVDAIEGKAELTIKPEQALRVIKVMQAAMQSWEKNEVIKTDI
ncbi:MAG: Gfo/Idh/MocA family oxidoreductase [Clostridia bacterium]|nr:Gfo/Idh/MocA family oxidoreductase [Clostridia bacterium]